MQLIPVAARLKAWFYGRSLPGIRSYNPSGTMEVSLLFSVACCQVEVSVTDW